MSLHDVARRMVVLSLQKRRIDLRSAATACEQAYTGGAMFDACKVLVSAYREAADVLDRALADYERQPAPVAYEGDAYEPEHGEEHHP